MRDIVASAPRPRFSHRFPVRFQDVDAAGIVFFARYFDYFHDGYLAFMAARAVDIPGALKTGAWAAPLKHAEADFLAPARYGDEVNVEIVGKRVEGSRVTLFHRLRREDTVLATARTDHVWVDVATFKRVPLPDDVTAALAEITDL